MANFCYYFIVIYFIPKCFGLFDPISLSVGALGLGLFGYNYDSIVDNTICRWTECCNDYYIPANIYKLKISLEKNLYGQHIAMDHIIPALQSHYAYLHTSTKPLVMSFQGTTGVGKNYVSDMIANSIYTKGYNSSFVHKFSGRIDFTEALHTNLYKNKLGADIMSAVSKCPRSLFIFDEVDMMPPGVFDSVTALLDYRPSLQGIDFRKAVFIFLSNTGGIEISKELGRLMNRGLSREETKLYHYEEIAELAAYNIEGGLFKGGPIQKSLIDHFIPFLPLEKRHIDKCIIDEFKRLNHQPTAKQIEEMHKQVTYEKLTGYFAKHGCKKLSKKSDVVAAGDF